MLYLAPEIYQMKKNLRLSRDKLDHLRLNLFKAQIVNIYENIPFYREFFKKQNLFPRDFNGLKDLKKLPIVTKEDIRDTPEMFLNVKMDQLKFFKSHTSGSTGEPFWSYFDKQCWLRKKYLSKLRARFACGMSIGEKVAVFESEPVEKLELLNKKRSIRDFFLHISYFSIFEDIEKGLEKLRLFKPQNVYGPPSYFFQLAQLVKERNRPVFFLKRIYTSAEYLESPVRQFIQNVLQANVFDVYGSTEFKEIAWECEQHEGYHINEDDVICEILNGKEPTRFGEEGDIVLTDLRNRAMPLIRYRIKDKGKYVAKSCSCGRTFTLMQPMAGRASEYIRLPNGERLSPYLLTTSIEKCKGLLQYQFIQTSRSDLTVNVIMEDKNNTAIFEEIKKITTEITKGMMRVSIQEHQEISVEENGKFRVVKNLLIEKETIPER